MTVLRSSWWLAPACALALLAGCKDTTSPGSASNDLPVADSATLEGVDRAALATLVSHAEQQHSEAVVILRNGKIVYESYFGFANEPLYAMSASKSFVSLAIGLLLGEGKIASLDEKVEKQLPGFTFHDPRKADITYRQLLSQTSGIDPTRAMMGTNDIEWTGIQAGCMFAPGTGWQYSNAGIDLLADLAGRLAGKPMDKYLNEKLFAPLGIAPVDWARDSKGVPYGAGEMKIRPMDMAKVGQMMLDGGKWNGKQVVPASWVAAVSAQSSAFEPTYGLLWWRGAAVQSVGVTSDLIAQWKGYGLSDDIATKLNPLVGSAYASRTAYLQAVSAALGKDLYGYWVSMISTGDHIPSARNLSVGTMAYYDAAGWLGQFLVVVPDKQLVGVRMRRNRASDYSSPTEVDGYPGFAADVVALVR